MATIEKSSSEKVEAQIIQVEALPMLLAAGKKITPVGDVVLLKTHYPKDLKILKEVCEKVQGKFSIIALSLSGGGNQYGGCWLVSAQAYAEVKTGNDQDVSQG